MAWNDDLDPNSAAYGIAAEVSDRIRVVAGPGTGKSFALKRRVARLLEEGIDPNSILPVTFTRVAAEDFHRELVGLEVPGCEILRSRTLHSLGLWILRRQNVLESTGRVPRILNQFELEPLLYDLPPNFGNKRQRAKRIRAFEAAWARLQNDEPGYAQDPEDTQFERVLKDWLRFHEAMLIGEIVPEVYRFLRDNPESPECRLFDQVLVDEFQDLNKAEQRVIELLGKNCSLCIVGDDDQSIYSFKYANPEGIRNWHEVHEGTADHLILDCRRCPVTIVEMANALIANNVDREDRELEEISENGNGEVRIIQYPDLNMEVAGIVEIVDELVGEREVPPEDILILAQRRIIGNPIHDGLLELEIPVNSYYQESELDTDAAQERFAILKLLVNSEDRIALRWLLGLGSSKFRAPAYDRVRSHSEATGLSPWAVMTVLSSDDISIPHTRHLIVRFREIEAEINELRGCEDLTALILQWLPDDLERVERLRELVEKLSDECDSFTELFDALIEEITQPEIPLEVNEVRVMSLHRSKGLSSPVVIIAGCIEGLLPVGQDGDLSPNENAAILEEQRRLFFVGLTRVKADPEKGKPGMLYLTHSRRLGLAEAMGSGITPANVRRRFAYVNASRFIAELGPSAPQTEQG